MEIGTVTPVRIEDELRNSYLDYAMSVIVSRSLPDVRDGLKPVHRRILYAMNEIGLHYNSAYKKSARIVGEVLGKYHPHGDAPVYEALVRMAQDFSMRYKLVEGQGNFGSVDNDPPAAMRYTEAKLAEISREMLADIDKDTVDFASNFDDSLKEPTILPARIPNLLINGSSGIAVGMATNIPPHNLSEVCEALTYIIDHPDATVDELLERIQGPDFPTGGVMLGEKQAPLRDALRKIYVTGQGKVLVQAQSSIEEMAKERHRIVITELPYQTNKAEVVEKISRMMREKKIEGISEIRDESDREGMRIAIELKRDTQPQQVLNNLYKHTAVQSAFFVNMLALVDGQPRVVSLREMLQYYIDFRRQVITRRSRFDLEQNRKRAHTLEGLKAALDQLDLVITIIRGSPSAEAARNELMNQIGLSQAQAQAVLDMQLRRLVSLERQKVMDELEETHKSIVYLEDILANPEKMLPLIKDELAEVQSRYGDPRRTVISSEEARAYLPEELIPHQPMMVTLSAAKYIKRIPYDTYRRQQRGGRGVSGMTIRESDMVQSGLVADTLDTLLFFTDRGKVYALKCYQIPAEASRTAKGVPLVNLLALDAKERIATVMNLKSFDEASFLVLITRGGKIKKVTLKSFAAIRSNGLIAMSLTAGDALVVVRVATKEDDVFLVGEGGEAIRFSVDALRTASRTSGGVRGLRLASGEHLAGADVASPGSVFLLVTAHGFGKRISVDIFPRQGRGGKGRRAYRVWEKTGKVVDSVQVSGATELMLVSAQGVIIRLPLEKIPQQRRNTQGASLMKLDPGDRVVSASSL